MSNEVKRWIKAFSSARHSAARSTSLCRFSTTLFAERLLLPGADYIRLTLIWQSPLP